MKESEEYSVYRRGVLGAMSAGALASIAGCMDGGSSDDEEGPDETLEDRTDEESTEDGSERTEGEGTESDPDDDARESDADDDTDEDGSDGEGVPEVQVAPGESIQAAVDDVESGGTVEVLEGTFEQSVTIDKQLSLLAPEGATLDGGNVDDGTALTVAGSGVSIEGFEIVGYAESAVRTDSQVDELTIADVELFDLSGQAVSVAGASVEISNVLAEDNSATALAIESTRDGDVTVRDATINRCGGAASITGGASVTVDGFEALKNDGDGIVVDGGDVRGQTVTISDGSVVEQREGSGIVVSGTRGDDEVTITNTEAIDNDEAGIDVTGGDVEFVGVEAVGNGPVETGVSITSTSDGSVTVRDTTVEETGRETAFWGSGIPGHGLSITDGADVTLENVSLSRNGSSNLLMEAENVRGQTVAITGSTIEGNENDPGISIAGSSGDDDVTIEGTDVLDHDEEGIYVGSGGDNSISIAETDVLNNGGNGVYVASDGDNEVTVENVAVKSAAENGLYIAGDVVDVVGVDVIDAVSEGGSEAGIVVHGTSDGSVTVRNTTVEGTSGGRGGSGNGISISDGKTVVVENVSLRNNRGRHLLLEAENVRDQTVEITGGTIENNEYGTGISVAGSSGDDVVTIANTDVYATGRDGIYVGSGGDDEVTIENVAVTASSDSGLDLSGGTVRVVGVDVTDAGRDADAGIAVRGTSDGDVSIRDTTVEGTAGGHGISVEDGKTVAVEQVSLRNNRNRNLRVEAENVRGQTVEITDVVAEGNEYLDGIVVSGSGGRDEVKIRNVESNGHDGYGFSLGAETVVIEGASADGNADGQLELTEIDEEDATIRDSF